MVRQCDIVGIDPCLLGKIIAQNRCILRQINLVIAAAAWPNVTAMRVAFFCI